MIVYAIRYSFSDYESSVEDIYGVFSTEAKANEYRDKLERNEKIKVLTTQKKVEFFRDLDKKYRQINPQPREICLSDRANPDHYKKLNEAFREWSVTRQVFLEEESKDWQPDIQEQEIESLVLEQSYTVHEWELDKEMNYE